MVFEADEDGEAEAIHVEGQKSVYVVGGAGDAQSAKLVHGVTVDRRRPAIHRALQEAQEAAVCRDAPFRDRTGYAGRIILNSASGPISK